MTVPAHGIRSEVEALIVGLNGACAQADVGRATMFLAAMDTMRTNDAVSDDEAVLLYRATCFLLDHPGCRTISSQIDSSRIAWRTYVHRTTTAATVARENLKQNDETLYDTRPDF